MVPSRKKPMSESAPPATATELTLTMPAESRFISTARITAASLAAELDFSIDEIEELRMGANELIALLTDFAEDHDVTSIDLRYVVEHDCIELHGSVDAPAGATAEPDILATQILDSVVDSYGFDGASAHLVKRRAAR